MIPPSLTIPPFPPAPVNTLGPARREQLLSALCEGVSDLVAVFDYPGLAPVYFNASALRLLMPNRVPEAASASTLRDFIGVDFVSRLEAEVLVHTRVMGRWSGRCVLRDEWGCEHAVAATFTWHGGAAGEGSYLSMRAVLSANEAAATSETAATDADLLHALLETIPDHVYFKDRNSRFIRVSQAMARRDGHADAGALIGRTDFDRMSVGAAQTRYDDERRILQTGIPIVEQEETVAGADGQAATLLTTKLPLRNRAGHLVGTFGISRDITTAKLADAERRDLELQLQINQKLESIGRLAAGIAHEINTPSQYITDNTRFLRDAFTELAPLVRELAAFAEDPEAKTCPAGARLIDAMGKADAEYLLREIPRTCEQSLEGLGRIARIVRSLKEFSHPGAPELTPSNLNRTVENVVAVSRHEWKYVAEVVLELDPDLPEVPCIVDAFGQAVLNLIVNAAHAIEDALKTRRMARGTISVRTRREGGHAVVEIGDTGTGIPEAIRDRVFEPFFTTKTLGRGTGQGLAIVQRIIVHDHHGAVDFETDEGTGTVFRLRLPLVVAPKPEAAAAAGAGPSS